MDKIATAVGGIILTIASLMLLLPLATLCGGIAGSIVGIFFGDTILGILGQLGIHNVTMFQTGAFLGFVGGFLKTKVDATVKAK